MLFHGIYTFLSLKLICCNLIPGKPSVNMSPFSCTFQVLGCVRKKSSLTTKPVTVRFIRLGYPAVKRGWINSLKVTVCTCKWMVGSWKMKFSLGNPIFRCYYVSLRECILQCSMMAISERKMMCQFSIKVRVRLTYDCKHELLKCCYSRFQIFQ